MSLIRILIVDDHPLMRSALRAVFETETDMQVAGEAINGRQAVELALASRPDVVVMDLLMPVCDGLSAIAALRQESPDIRILALTSSTDDRKVEAALQAGALGYLLKDVQRAELVQAVREVALGRVYLPPAVTGQLVRRVRHPAMAPNGPDEPLTEREREVLGLLARGCTNREIAEAMCVSEGTARTHVHNILRKLGLKHRGQAILYALQCTASTS
jgi:NarL family two-component system response regulator LiaR